ncbi:MAG: bacterial Ig-like domain-containing protein [Clostridia bacterium]|nr:bacterial Ig-like domain-containing protein [Clostridia bacterium]
MNKKLLTVLFVVVVVLAVASMVFVGCDLGGKKVVLSNISVSYNGEALDFGSQLNLQDIQVKLLKSDSSEEVLADLSEVEISGFNPNQLGVQSVTVSYQGFTATFDVEVIKTLQSISAEYNGDQLYVGQDIDKNDIEVKKHFSDSSEELVSANDFEISGYDKDTAGDQTVSVAAFNLTASFSVNVQAVEIDHLSAEVAEGAVFYEGTGFGYNYFVVTAFYNDGSSESIPRFGLDGYDLANPGAQTWTISYGGASVELEVTVVALALDHITAKYVGGVLFEGDDDLLSIEDFEITAFFNNGDKGKLEEEDYEDASLGEFDLSEFGDKEIPVSFTFRGETKSCNAALYVKGSVESISVSYVGGLKYVDGFLFGTDVEVNAVYSDSEEPELVKYVESKQEDGSYKGNYSFRGFDSSEAGEKTVTVIYAAGNGSAQATFTVTVLEPDPNSYTLHDYMGASPTNFNPHTWETSADNVISGYAEMAFVDTTIAPDGINFQWVLEMAESITDVTADYAVNDNEGNPQKLGGKVIVPEGVTSGQVYRIALNQAAKWEDGTPINADTYIESMKRLLEPKMQNYRANTYYNGDTAIKNAKAYFNAGAPLYDTICDASFNYLPLEGKTLAFTWQKAVPFFGSNSAKDYYDAGYTSYFKDADGNDLYKKWSEKHNPYGVVNITEENIDEILADLVTISRNFGDTNPTAYNEWLLYLTGYGDAYDWENVGLLKIDDYTIDYILEDATSEFYFYTGMTGNWLVYIDLYDELTDKSGDLWTTTYGTSAATYKSYGPYKLDTFQKDKQFTFSRNTNWYGWTDGKHDSWTIKDEEGEDKVIRQYMTTNIIIDIIANEATIENMFLAGQLDSLGLNSTQLAQYRTSANLLKTDQTYTFRFIFATSKASLEGLEEKYGGNDNLKILSYKDFRKAMSLAINRTEFAAQATGGYKPAYSLFSSLYYYNIENDTESVYRRTDVAMKAICDLYGVRYGAGTDYATLEEAYNSITGQDVAQAKALFNSAYEAAVAAGDYTDGQNIVIHCMCSAASELSEDDTAQERLLNAYMAAATEGTPLEGKISFVFNCGDSKRYDHVAAGEVEMIRGAWGGAAFYPFSTIRVYTNPAYMGGLAKIHESNGWNPSTEKLTLVYDFDGDGTEEELEMTLENWSNTINGGVKEDDGTFSVPSFDDPNTKLFIMSKLEKAVLESYQCIPWATETACSLFSHKISYATLNYNIMFGYGGMRLMTFNYNDAEWAAYVKAQGGALNY